MTGTRLKNAAAWTVALVLGLCASAHAFPALRGFTTAPAGGTLVMIPQVANVQPGDLTFCSISAFNPHQVITPIEPATGWQPMLTPGTTPASPADNGTNTLAVFVRAFTAADPPVYVFKLSIPVNSASGIAVAFSGATAPRAQASLATPIGNNPVFDIVQPAAIAPALLTNSLKLLVLFVSSSEYEFYIPPAGAAPVANLTAPAGQSVFTIPGVGAGLVPNGPFTFNASTIADFNAVSVAIQ